MLEDFPLFTLLGLAWLSGAGFGFAITWAARDWFASRTLRRLCEEADEMASGHQQAS